MYCGLNPIHLYWLLDGFFLHFAFQNKLNFETYLPFNKFIHDAYGTETSDELQKALKKISNKEIACKGLCLEARRLIKLYSEILEREQIETGASALKTKRKNRDAPF
jgi:hypothetical protein